MAVFSMHLGHRIQTTCQGRLEGRITGVIPGVHIGWRMLDQNLDVRLRIERDKGTGWGRGMINALGPNIGCPSDDSAPRQIHIKVASHGHVHFRVMWMDVAWTGEVEQAAKALCQWIGDRLLLCC